MDNLKGYRDLLQEIELWDLRMQDLNRERRYLIQRMSRPPSNNMTANYSGMPGAAMVIVNIPKQWQRIQEIDAMIEECRDILSLKKDAKKRMEKIMEKMDRLEYRVAYLRDVRKLQLKEIAAELQLTEGWIRKVSMRVPRIRTKIPS